MPKCDFWISDFVLAGLYSILLILTAFELYRCQQRTKGLRPEKQRTAQKLFLSLVTLQCCMRAMGFYAMPAYDEPPLSECSRQMIDDTPNWVVELLTTLPLDIYISCFSILVLKFAQIYHSALNLSADPDGRSVTFRNLKIVLIILNLFMYSTFITAMAYYGVDEDDVPAAGVARMLVLYTEGGVALIIGLGFAFYGTALFVMYQRLTRAGDASGSRSKGFSNLPTAIKNIIVTSSITTVCFILRAFTLLIRLDYSRSWLIYLFYYLLVEVIPTCLMIYVFHSATNHIKSERVSSFHRYNSAASISPNRSTHPSEPLTVPTLPSLGGATAQPLLRASSAKEFNGLSPAAPVAVSLRYDHLPPQHYQQPPLPAQHSSVPGLLKSRDVVVSVNSSEP